MKKLLLHSCCGPCSTAVIERLLESGEYDITVFYYNPNITDREEYEHRRSEQIRLIGIMNSSGRKIGFIDGDYDTACFYRAAEGLEAEPEGGARCRECFILRLKKTAELARDLGFDCFDTTLTVSPYKSYDVISEIGRSLSELTGVDYLSGNYKKKDGYRRSVELSREYGLYRQHYCGCGFSKAESERIMARRAAENESPDTESAR